MTSSLSLLLLSALHLLRFEPTSSSIIPDSDLLPDEFPNDSSSNLPPIFVTQPTESYATKGKPAEVVCSVAHASKVNFVCNGESVESLTESEQGGIRRITLGVSREDILDGLGRYTCKCVASSDNGVVESQEIGVSIARLSRDFETPPYSQTVEEGGQLELRCHPPKGNPPAQVSHWLKNGEKITSERFPGFIITNPGHLLISLAELEDSGNYTCVATNGVLLRRSDPATVKVYVRGGWSEWSSWSSCSSRCDRGIKKRTRTCDSPTPYNGGPGCEGLFVEKKSCSRICPSVDGGWSSWTPWSSCGSDCIQFRRRRCDDPTPKYSGNYCSGRNMESQNCTGGICKAGLNSIVLYGTEPITPSKTDPVIGTTDLTLCIGLVVAFVVFIVVVVVMIKMIKKKGTRPHSGYTLANGGGSGGNSTSSGGAGGESKKPASSSSTLSYGAPDIVQRRGGMEDADEDLDDLASERSGKYLPKIVDNSFLALDETRPLSEHYYEQPMVVFQGSPRDVRPKVSSNPPSSSGHSSPSFDQNVKRFFQKPPPTLRLPRSVDFHYVNWATVTETGSRITVPRSTVSLTVPQGAVMPSGQVDLFVAVIQKEEYKPLLDERSSISVTPILQCGPTDARLLKPVVLSLPHIVGCRIPSPPKILYKRDLDTSEEWEIVRQNAISIQVDSSMVHIVTEKLGSYLLVADVTDLNSIGGSARIPSSSSSASSGFYSSSSSSATPLGEVLKLSPSTKAALCRILDVPTCQGNDWHQLAEVLGVSQYVPFFASQPSPSEALLNLWEARSSNTNDSLLQLAHLLRSIKREDAAIFLDRDIKS